jgi:hypothetical protein
VETSEPPLAVWHRSPGATLAVISDTGCQHDAQRFSQMDFVKPLRQRGRKSAQTCNVLFSLGGNTILRFPGNLCARMSGLGFKVTGAGPLLSCYAGCHLGHNETICGAEVFKNKTSAPKIARGRHFAQCAVFLRWQHDCPIPWGPLRPDLGFRV